jgi:glycosyltransferase involved in cell wall biosynthesis
LKKYSIILPVYNGGNLVKECVHSILSQSYEDFNLIVLDNCSTDGTAEWITKIADERINIIPSISHLTIEENWARILNVKKNKFSTLIGHDDILKSNFLETIDNLIDNNNPECLFFTHFSYINSLGENIRDCQKMPLNLNSCEFIASFLNNNIDVMGTGFVFLSERYDRVGGIPMYPNLLFADFELWINLIDKNSLVISPENCFQFRLHNSTTTSSSVLKFYNAYKRFIFYMRELSLKANYSQAVLNNLLKFIKFYTKGISHKILKTNVNSRKDLTVDAVYREYKQNLKKFNFKEDKKFNRKILFAKFIDENILLSNFFLLYKDFKK